MLASSRKDGGIFSDLTNRKAECKGHTPCGIIKPLAQCYKGRLYWLALAVTHPGTVCCQAIDRLKLAMAEMFPSPKLATLQISIVSLTELHFDLSQMTFKLKLIAQEPL